MRYLLGSGMVAFSLTAALAGAQVVRPADATLPRFTVASVKPSADNDPGMKIEPRQDGSYTVRKATLSSLLANAFGIPSSRIIGMPDWWKVTRFDVDARYERPDPSAAVPPVPLMLRSLLRDRFALAAHVEQREFPVFVLRVARRDRQLGPGLTPSTQTCDGIGRPTNAGDRGTAAPNGAPACGALENPEQFIASGMSLDVLASALRPAAGRDVIDETGLTGSWDITLQFSPGVTATADRPSVFTAVQEQLGLTLESEKRVLDVLIVDHVEPPTAN